MKAAIGKWCESRLRARILVERERAGSLKPGKSGLGPFWVVELFFFFSHKSKSGLFLLKGEKWQKLYSMYKIFQVFLLVSESNCKQFLLFFCVVVTFYMHSN